MSPGFRNYIPVQNMTDHCFPPVQFLHPGYGGNSSHTNSSWPEASRICESRPQYPYNVGCNVPCQCCFGYRRPVGGWFHPSYSPYISQFYNGAVLPQDMNVSHGGMQNQASGCCRRTASGQTSCSCSNGMGYQIDGVKMEEGNGDKHTPGCGRNDQNRKIEGRGDAVANSMDQNDGKSHVASRWKPVDNNNQWRLPFPCIWVPYNDGNAGMKPSYPSLDQPANQAWNSNGEDEWEMQGRKRIYSKTVPVVDSIASSSPVQSNGSRSPSHSKSTDEQLKGDHHNIEETRMKFSEREAAVVNHNIEETRMKFSEREAAVVIQSVYRGCAVRRLEPLKKLKQLAQIRENIVGIRRQVDDLGACYNEKQILVLEESIMKQLLQLDAVQGVHPCFRDVRKSLARELLLLQERLDAIKSEAEAAPSPITNRTSDDEKHTKTEEPIKTGEKEDESESGSFYKKLVEENERLRQTMEQLVKAGKEQLEAISQLRERVNDMETRLSRRRQRLRKYKLSMNRRYM